MAVTSTSGEVVLNPNPKASLPGILFLGGFMGIWSGGFFGGIAVFVGGALGLGHLVLPLAIGIAAVGFVGTIFLNYSRVKSTRYTVSPTSIEAESGLLSTSVTTVSFDDVTDVHYKQSFLDKRFGVGSVKLNTAGSNDKAITVSHVPDARMLYDELEGRIND